MEDRKRIKILTKIIENKGFELRHKNSEKKTITKIFGTVKVDDPEYADNLNGAKSLNNIGYDVYVLPKIVGSKSFDYILVKDKKIYSAELKTIYGKNSIDHRLEKASKQSDRVVLNIVGNITSRNAAEKIKDFYLENSHVREIIVLKSGKPIVVRYGQVKDNKRFVSDFMNRWAW